MTYLWSTPVFAHVRPIGSVGPFAERRFEFMLDAHDTLQAKRREAARILAQLGYQARGTLIFPTEKP